MGEWRFFSAHWLNLRSLAVFFLVAAVFLLAFNPIHDADAWLHLSLGKLIWNLKRLPVNEVYTYPSSEMPFSYSSWLFGLICYLTYLVSGASGLVLLKSVAITLAFYIVLRDSLRPYDTISVAAGLVMAAALFSQSRFVLRPDIFLMVFLSFSIFSLNAFLYSGKKYIYALPVIHMLWANSHSSINLMAVPFAAFLAGGLLECLVKRKESDISGGVPNTAQLKTITLFFFLSFVASLISPYFIGQYFHGSQYLISKWYKQEILELRPPTGSDKIVLYVSGTLLLISFALVRKRLSFIHLFLVIPFIYVPFVSVRFMFLLFLVGAPVFVRNIGTFLEVQGVGNAFGKRAATIAVSVWIVLSCTLALAQIGPFSTGRKIGQGFDYSLMPRGAVQYMDRNKITGRVFNTFHFGQYITWTGYPGRTVFMDSRVYLPPGLLGKTEEIWNSPSSLDELQRAYGFKAILIEYLRPRHDNAELLSEIDRSFSHPEWALVYWDDISLLYLKRGTRYDSVIEQDEYRFIKPGVTFNYFLKHLGGQENRDNLLTEIKRNLRETASSRSYAFLGLLYYSSGLYEQAIGAMSRVRPVVRHNLEFLSFVVTGDSYNELGDFKKSLHYYRKALNLRETPYLVYKMGLLFLQENELHDALDYLERAVELDSGLLQAYPPLITAYQALGREEEVRQVREKFLAMKTWGRAKEHFNRGVRAYFERKYDLAIREYERSLEISPSNFMVYANLGYVYFDTGQLDKAFDAFNKALGINPGYAKAHYGMAFLYKKRGDVQMARKHFQRFVELEPSGNLSREAIKQISALSPDK